MKTSIVAVIAASLFLIGAYMGLGSRPGAPPGAPQMIAIAGPASDAGTPAAADLPLTLPSSPAASQVLAVGRQVVPGSLKDMGARAPASGSGRAVDTAAGPAGTDQQVNASLNETVEPLPRSATGATPPASTVGKPAPTPYPTIAIPPTHRPPRPEPSPTPQPIPTPKPSPTPTPSPTPVTATVTPPVTSTASSSSPAPSPHP